MKLGNPKTNADVQMSEAFVTSVFLALSGGFQDAYTYFTREEVFSNAQTGNIVLMSTILYWILLKKENKVKIFLFFGHC